jgi:hypothetical protein
MNAVHAESARQAKLGELMEARNRWILPTVVALLSFVLPVPMLSIVYITAPDSPLFAGPSFPIALMPPGSMPDFPNDPLSPLFLVSTASSILAAALIGASAVLVLGLWFRRAKPSSLCAAVVGPVALWLLVFVIPMSHRVIRDYNAGFTRTDMLSYTAILGAWVLAAVVSHLAFMIWARRRWESSPS